MKKIIDETSLPELKKTEKPVIEYHDEMSHPDKIGKQPYNWRPIIWSIVSILMAIGIYLMWNYYKKQNENANTDNA